MSGHAALQGPSRPRVSGLVEAPPLSHAESLAELMARIETGSYERALMEVDPLEKLRPQPLADLDEMELDPIEVLLVLRMDGNVTVGDLMADVGVSPSDTLRALSRLIRRNLVRLL